jgi:NTP pyrophosphatase (non-canonical NTP hydrolase)
MRIEAGIFQSGGKAPKNSKNSNGVRIVNTHYILVKLKDFREERDWGQFHTAPNLAASVSIEAGELLELYQWGREAGPWALADEVADVFIYLIQLCEVEGINLEKAVHQKIKKNADRYPVDKSWGNATKYNQR